MLAYSGGPVKGPSHRGSDSCNSTGLDYSTCYRIESDIPTRIRSLLLSRQAYRPPRTPWPSDEMASRHQDDYDSVESFDFNTARSVAKSVRLNSEMLSLPSKQALDKPYIPEMLPVFCRRNRPALHGNSSSFDRRGMDRSLDGVDATAPSQAVDDVMIHQTLLSCCPPRPPGEADIVLLDSQHMTLKPERHTYHESRLTATSPELAALGLEVKDALGDSLHLASKSERHSTLPGPSVRYVPSRSSLRAKDRPPSLETTTSKTSACRHALLKPSMTAWHPIDVGLPVQPVLINAPDILPTSGTPSIPNDDTAGHSHNHPLADPVEALTSLLEMPQHKGLAEDGEFRTPNHTRETDPKALPYHPTVKLGVGVVNQNFLGPIVYQAASPTTGELNHVSEAYQSLPPEPLAEAALRAEEYLKRKLSWGNESSTRRQVGINSIPEHTDRISSLSSVAQVDIPNRNVPDGVASFENLTPQESLDTRVATPDTEATGGLPEKSSWRIASWKQSPQETSFQKSTIPSHESSLDEKIPTSRTNFTKIPSRRNFLEQLVSGAGRRVLTTSSTSSSMTPNPQLPRNDSGEEMYDIRIAANWLREILSGHEPYTPRLTAIPPRKHRLPRVVSKPVRRSATQSHALIKQSEPRASETFNKTINDLENLMSEALHIARQATEREDAQQVPSLLSNATALHDTVKQRAYNRRHLRSVLRSQLSDMLSCRESDPENVSGASSDCVSQESDISQYIYEKPHSRKPSEIARPSDGNVVVQPAAMPRNQSAWSLSRASTSHAVPVLAGLKAIATGLLHKSINVQVSKHETVSDKASVTSLAAEVPKIRGGNPESSLCVRSENQSELPLDEQSNNMRSKAAEPQQSTLVEKKTPAIRQPYERDISATVKAKRPSKTILNKREVTEFIRVFHQPPIQSRHSSLALRRTTDAIPQPVAFTSAVSLESNRQLNEISSQRSFRTSSIRTLSTSQGSVSELHIFTPQGFCKHAGLTQPPIPDKVYELKDSNEGQGVLPKRHISGRRLQDKLTHLKNDRLSNLNLRGKSHISLQDHKGFSLSRSHRRQPIARDWSPARKRFSASVACISTALIGVLVGIYAGEVPSIQYYIADFNHYAILGNVVFFITLAITTFLFWPLPLLHGRKPYILAALTLAMPLLFPQAISVSMQRSPYVATWRVLLILPRTLMGAALGFANINFMATLTDLFGASLQSSNPHQETVDELDVRRHGGGLGVWLGIWTWCYIGSIGVGFLIGALVINTMSPDWGFYVSVVIIAAVLLLNVVTPEVRRSAYRRSVAEIRTSNDISRRLARGEVMMHRLQTGPKWWGQEFHHGVMLSLDMLRQPGFLVMSSYVAWMYGQIVLTIVLLGSLMSKYYRFTSPAVGATTMAIPLGALLAVPFQKASLFSRARRRPQRTDSMTFDTKVTFSSHLVRRAIFTLVLPFAGLAFTLSSAGPPTPFILPVLFAGLIGFLSNLAIAECNGIIMETFDTSDLQPGMTGRPRGASGERTKHKRTNYSSFPRVSSAFAIIQALGFLIGAAATGVGGVAERRIGQQAATGAMAGILLILTLGVLGILYRFKEVQIIPNHNEEDMEKWERERKMSVQRQEEAVRQGAVNAPTPELEEPWRPIIIGNPSGKTRRMSILELGHLSRWSEIRRKNRLVDEMSQEARHPNLATLEDVRKEMRPKNLGSLQRLSSRRSQRSKLSQGSEEPEADMEVDLGHRSKST